jgi:hypothetical protein
VGSTNDMQIREKAHRKLLPKCCRDTPGFPDRWEMRSIVEMTCGDTIESKRAEGYWILRLRDEGHPVFNTSLEAWPREAWTNRIDWWPYIEAWAATKGFVDLKNPTKYVTAADAAELSGRSRQYVSRCAKTGAFKGALRVGNAQYGFQWVIPESEILKLGPPIKSAETSRVILTMALVRDGLTPYAAAKQVGIALSTIYRSKLYKEWKNEKKPRS